MDTLNHAATGAAIAYASRLRLWSQILFLAFLGALPDIIGWLEKFLSGDYTRWGWYLNAHLVFEPTWLVGVLTLGFILTSAIYIFDGSANNLERVLNLFSGGWLAYYLHVFLDRFTHTPGKEWWIWPNTMWIEILTWILIVSYFTYAYTQHKNETA